MSKRVRDWEIHMNNGDTFNAREGVDGDGGSVIERNFMRSRMAPDGIQASTVHIGAGFQMFAMKDVCWIRKLGEKEIS